MGQVISLQDKRRKAALERLNRLTGLNFSHYPESLVRAEGTPGNLSGKASRKA